MAAIGYLRPAILDRILGNGHALVEADAGTGKTHTIEHLVLELLLTARCSVEEILVMTFTEKATTELRTGIRRLIERVLSGDFAGDPAASNDSSPDDSSSDAKWVPVDDNGRDVLERALFSFDRASIHTIHGFCQRVLSDFAFQSGVRFDLEVVDGRIAFHRAFRNELRESFATDEVMKRLLDEWLFQEDSAARDSLVSSLEDLLYEAHYKRYLDSGAQLKNQNALEDLAKEFDAAALKQFLSRLRGSSRTTALAVTDELAEAIRKSSGQVDDLRSALSHLDLGPLSQAAGRIADAPPSVRRLLQTINDARCAASLHVRVVDSFLPPVTKRLAEDKQRLGQIDYDDMLAWVWKVLDSPRGQALAAAMRARFRYAVVDEFQDTDDLQWQILRRIFIDSGENSFYAVGDPKQAIYSFRGADVFTYLQARAKLKEIGVDVVPLKKNFRSTRKFIGACNLILNQSAENAIFQGEIRCEGPAECGRPHLAAHTPDGKTIIPVTLLRYAPDNGKGSAAQMRAAIGRRIASELQRILSDGPNQLTITDKNAKPRVVGPGDVFILTRTNAESAEIGAYLREAGVPFAFYKQDGLFQTSEARDILDVLRAIQDPGSRSKRLKAWASPFFAIPFERLPEIGEVPGNHPLIERLLEWKGFADRENYAELFRRILHESGLAYRELFWADSERELTNYAHILEILLNEGSRERLAFGDIIARLESYAAESASPPGQNGNIQRLESERQAVQIMTVHLSKGLQADVVFLFGGTGRPRDRSNVAVYHHDYQRRLAVGPIAKGLAKSQLAAEEQEESARLIYVALTRARAKLYLPVFPNGSTKRNLDGYYARLNERLKEMLSSSAISKQAGLIEVQDVSNSAGDLSADQHKEESLRAKLDEWKPQRHLLDGAAQSEAAYKELRDRHRALITCSYTTLNDRSFENSGIEPEDFKYDRSESEGDADLPGGRHVGIFLHEVIEKLDFDSLGNSITLDAWKTLPETRRLFEETMRRHQVRDPHWLDRGAEIVFNALRTPLRIRDGVSLGPLYGCRNVREMEFVYPIPERIHPLLASGLRDGKWTAERGYLKGFVDLVFEDGGLIYFADWKSDLLSSYQPAAIEAHVRKHYELQEQIYSVGVVRLLRIRDEDEYNRRFGGLVYLFLRGVGAGGNGIYFHHPPWRELIRYESKLGGVIPPLHTAQ